MSRFLKPAPIKQVLEERPGLEPSPHFDKISFITEPGSPAKRTDPSEKRLSANDHQRDKVASLHSSHTVTVTGPPLGRACLHGFESPCPGCGTPLARGNGYQVVHMFSCPALPPGISVVG